MTETESSTTEDPHEIRVAQETADDDVDPLELERAALHTLQRHDVSSSELSIAVVGDETMSRLHADHLSIPGPTDVLTFDLRDPTTPGDRIEGEIVVCADVARREASGRGHSPANELTLYVVHGVLHLLGYDDHDPDDFQRMHAQEDVILTELGVGPTYKASES